MLCIEQLKTNIVNEIKYNPRVTTLTQAYFKDKEVIALDINFEFHEYFPMGEAKLEVLRRVKEIHYILSRNRTTLHLSALHSSHHPDVYRTHMSNIWDHYRDVNKIPETTWASILKRLNSRYTRFRSNETVCHNYIKALEMWIQLSDSANHLTEELAQGFKERLVLAKQALETFKVEEDASTTDVLPSSKG